MARERLVTCLLAMTCPGCSLILDFSDSAAPHDAATDAPYTQAECDYKEPNDTVETAAVIVAGDVGPAAICARAPDAGGLADVDYYKFTVSTATTVTIAIQFTNRPGGDLDLALVDATGLPIASSRGFGDGETITCPGASPACGTLAPGDYVFEVFPAVTGAVNAYTFSVQ
jgi:hypothetical protein